MSELIGRTLAGRYKILSHIGEGGMAEVYRARHIALDRLVAVKVMLEYLAHEQSFRARFEQEARLIARLHHPNIIQEFDYEAIEAEHLYYMVVELINGPSLSDVLHTVKSQGEHLPFAEVVRISQDVASALSYAHGQGMIHRDIKPGNILLEGGKRVVLTDFGLARLAIMPQNAMDPTSRDSILGTAAYMAPELGLSVLSDVRSDMYSLGATMYQMLTNREPFQADTPLAVMMQHINTIAQPPHEIVPDVPIGLENIVMRLLAKKPDDRY